ncbi:MAG: DUF86 domain-containing protein [Alphaproteobacteria bacterium]|nr:DUF86 domain-containing protein [Alphaproteobacteria bacterium]
MPADSSGWRDTALLLDIVLAAEDALSFAAALDEQAFLASDLHQSAIIRKFAIMGEAAGKVSKEFRAAHGEIPWAQMTGLRHRLVHDYGDVRLDIIWRVVKDTLPDLVASLRPLIPAEDSDDALPRA